MYVHVTLDKELSFSLAWLKSAWFKEPWLFAREFGSCRASEIVLMFESTPSSYASRYTRVIPLHLLAPFYSWLLWITILRMRSSWRIRVRVGLSLIGPFASSTTSRHKRPTPPWYVQFQPYYCKVASFLLVIHLYALVLVYTLLLRRNDKVCLTPSLTPIMASRSL